MCFRATTLFRNGSAYAGFIRRIDLTFSKVDLGRRDLLIRGSWFGLGAACAVLSTPSLGQEPAVLEVAYAGSMGSIMEGPVKKAAAQTLRLDMHGRAQGANALAQLIVGGSISPDVFIRAPRSRRLPTRRFAQ